MRFTSVAEPLIERLKFLAVSKRPSWPTGQKLLFVTFQSCGDSMDIAELLGFCMCGLED